MHRALVLLCFRLSVKKRNRLGNLFFDHWGNLFDQRLFSFKIRAPVWCLMSSYTNAYRLWKKFFKRTIWLPHTSTLPVRGAGALISGPSPRSRCLSWVSHCLRAPASIYVIHSLTPRFPGLLSHSLSDLNLVTDFCILSSSCVTKPCSLAACVQSADLFSLSPRTAQDCAWSMAAFCTGYTY